MINRNIICIVLLVVIATSKTTIFNLPESFVPKNEAEYANYLQVMLGHYVESSIISDNIKVLINNERPSLLTAPEKVVLILATVSGQGNTYQAASIASFGGNQLKQLVQKYQTIFEVKVMLNVNHEKLEQEIASQQSKGSLVNVIIGEEKEILKLKRTLVQQDQVHAPRRLQQPNQAATTDNTYLIKFFFSIIFILVIVSCVGFIAQNEGKKDTLLYAKFIADVGGR